MKDWSDQSENITKLIMLESGYYDGKVTIDRDVICEAILQNIDEGYFNNTLTRITDTAPVIARVIVIIFNDYDYLLRTRFCSPKYDDEGERKRLNIITTSLKLYIHNGTMDTFNYP